MKLITILLAAVILAGCNFISPSSTDISTPVTNNNQTTPEKPIPSNGSSLNLSNQGLTSLPQNVLQQTNLTELDISNNSIGGALPAEIRFLSRLRVLKANNNRMTGVPAEVGQLSQLEILNLANNQLTGLPNELSNLSNLKTLDLRGNNPSTQDVDYIRQRLPNATILLD